MILLHNLKGAMQFDSSKDIPVYVSTSASYDFNALTPIMQKLWHW